MVRVEQALVELSGREIERAVAQIPGPGLCGKMSDEWKCRWGWTGFSTADLKRSQLMARLAALIFNGWSNFAWLATEGGQWEALATRPYLLAGISAW